MLYCRRKLTVGSTTGITEGNGKVTGHMETSRSLHSPYRARRYALFSPRGPERPWTRADKVRYTGSKYERNLPSPITKGVFLRNPRSQSNPRKLTLAQLLHLSNSRHCHGNVAWNLYIEADTQTNEKKPFLNPDLPDLSGALVL